MKRILLAAAVGSAIGAGGLALAERAIEGQRRGLNQRIDEMSVSNRTTTIQVPDRRNSL